MVLQLTARTRLAFQCTICNKDYDLVRDHCHKTGYIRGILCNRCNSWLGVIDNRKRRNNRIKKWYSENTEIINTYRSQHIGIQYKSQLSKELLKAMRYQGVSSQSGYYHKEYWEMAQSIGCF